MSTITSLEYNDLPDEYNNLPHEHNNLPHEYNNLPHEYNLILQEIQQYSSGVDTSRVQWPSLI